MPRRAKPPECETLAPHGARGTLTARTARRCRATCDPAVAGLKAQLRSRSAAYAAGQRYALGHDLELLDPTPFSDTTAIAVAFNYAVQNQVQSISDLVKVSPQLTLGAAPQF